MVFVSLPLDAYDLLSDVLPSTTYTTSTNIIGKHIELRSDTFTKPTPGMRQAMMAAEVGDDCYKEDKTCARLEETVAGKLSKLWWGVIGVDIPFSQTTHHACTVLYRFTWERGGYVLC